MRYPFASALLLLAVLAGCEHQPSPQRLERKTADATAAAKRDAKAVAQGLREGWNRGDSVDLNSATKQQLTRLPGITPLEADRVIAGRPYNQPEELVTKHILTKAEYDKIAGQVTTGK